jgi:hypothetical protein
MFARAVQAHQQSSQQKCTPSQAQISPAVQKTIDFSGGAKRKALDVIEDPNQVHAVKHMKQSHGPGSGLIAALSGMDSFVETQGQVLLDGEVFDEADFDDIDIDDWESLPTATPVMTTAVKVKTEVLSGTVKKEVIEEDDYFQDVSDLDWDAADITPAKPETISITQASLKSSPPGVAPPPIIQPLETSADATIAINAESLQNKENHMPPPSSVQELVPVKEEPHDLGKVLFPSSAPYPWSSSPVVAKNPAKRTLPWVANPNRYGPPATAPTTQYRKEKTQIKSIVHERTAEGTRQISTMAMESNASVDWDVLGLSEKDIFARKKQERADELRVKQEQAKRGMEWIDQAPVAPVAATRRRRVKTEDTAINKQEKNKLVGDRKPLAQVFLSQEQLSVRKLVVEDKRSVFFTGSAGTLSLYSDGSLTAGTGKSVLLREIITALKTSHSRNPEAVAVTASTGLAACNVGGITLHSFAAFGLGKESVQELVKKVKKNKKGFERWRRTKVLIIDESIDQAIRILFADN